MNTSSGSTVALVPKVTCKLVVLVNEHSAPVPKYVCTSAVVKFKILVHAKLPEYPARSEALSSVTTTALNKSLNRATETRGGSLAS
eukprot:CAMPEP_0114388982 /NCGR_PEP_ID=MMETSP0102-20121206/8342_1 /TAXON_ID=38822 ORGANISM="Pteridomonas danica, Strain PT" /NCGR_SAMPLE_ID=MMETSP0102 /ASSEMBLY_ACC=CAM_ASM_000212 /LENGTH=85 /DNA_ID=CAMNT_0001546705 /DNA_START=38 /DNA_END=295 /DNA_ORIENTATION=-